MSIMARLTFSFQIRAIFCVSQSQNFFLQTDFNKENTSIQATDWQNNRTLHPTPTRGDGISFLNLSCKLKPAWLERSIFCQIFSIFLVNKILFSHFFEEFFQDAFMKIIFYLTWFFWREMRAKNVFSKKSSRCCCALNRVWHMHV